MKYRLTYRIARAQEKNSEHDITQYQLGLFVEEVEENLILQKMKEIEIEHRNNVEHIRGLPQFALFMPVEKVS